MKASNSSGNAIPLFAPIFSNLKGFKNLIGLIKSISATMGLETKSLAKAANR